MIIIITWMTIADLVQIIYGSNLRKVHSISFEESEFILNFLSRNLHKNYRDISKKEETLISKHG